MPPQIILKNKVIFYLASRYLTYFVQFVTSLVIAAELGPYYMGIWGFILLLLQYFQQFHFGIANSFNVLYVHHRGERQECDNYTGNSLVLIGYLAGMVILFYLYYQFVGIEGFEKYHAGKYIVYICLIAILQYFVQFFINLFRVKNQLNRVTFCQSIIVLLNFVCIFFFRGEQLIVSLVTGYVIGNVSCVILAFTSGSIPALNDVKISISYQKEILKKGIYLFLYNSCFYFIIISIRTIISANYSVEEFGMFTFSFSLAHAIMLILEAFSFIIFPKVISKLSSDNMTEVENTISLLRSIYITSAHFLVYLALPCFPILLHFMPKYSGTITALNLIALTILMSTCSYGYLELLIARNKEKTAAILAAFALLFNGGIAMYMVTCLHCDFSHVILATMITYYLFSLVVCVRGRIFMEKKGENNLLNEFFPVRLAIPYFTALTLSIFRLENLIVITVFCFVFLNWKQKKNIIRLTQKILSKPSLINL